MEYQQTQVSTLICDSKKLKTLDAISSRLTSIQNIIYFEDDSKEEDAFSGSLGNWTIASFSEVEKLGEESPAEPSLPSKDAIAVVMYTSGSTGLPKVGFFFKFCCMCPSVFVYVCISYIKSRIPVCGFLHVCKMFYTESCLIKCLNNLVPVKGCSSEILVLTWVLV